MSIVSALVRCGFVILLAYAAHAITSRARTGTWIFAGNPPPWKASNGITREDDLTLGLWQQHTFVEIKKSQDFVRQKLAESPQPIGAIKRKVLADFIVAFLNSYSSDDFELFWSFRVPTGRYTSTDGAKRALADYVENVRRSYSLSGSASNATDAKSIMSVAWRNNVLARGKDIQKGEKKPQELCTGCLSAVAVDALAIRESPVYGVDPEALLERMKRFPNWGASVLPSFLDVHTASDSAHIQDYVDVELFIKLTSGKAQPIHIVAGWDDSGHCYIPMKIAMPRASFDRPAILL